MGQTCVTLCAPDIFNAFYLALIKRSLFDRFFMCFSIRFRMFTGCDVCIGNLKSQKPRWLLGWERIQHLCFSKRSTKCCVSSSLRISPLFLECCGPVSHMTHINFPSCLATPTISLWRAMVISERFPPASFTASGNKYIV